MSDNMDHTHNASADALVHVPSDTNLPQIVQTVEDTEMAEAPVLQEDATTPKPQRTLQEEKCGRLWRHVQKV